MTSRPASPLHKGNQRKNKLPSIASTTGRRHLLLRLCRLHCQNSRSATSFTTTMSPALPAQPVGDIFYYDYVACIARTAGRRHLLLRLCRLHCQNSRSATSLLRLCRLHCQNIRSATSFTTTMSPALPAQPVGDIFYFDYVACIASTAGRRHLLLRLCRLHCQHNRSATYLLRLCRLHCQNSRSATSLLRRCRLHCQNSRSATSFTTTMSPALPAQPVGDIFYYDYVACIASIAGRRHLLLRLCRLHCQHSRSATSFTTTMSPALPA